MILDLIAIFRARRNPRQATKLAARFAQGQAIDRLATPIVIVQLLLWVTVAAMVLLTGLLIFGANALHGSILIIAVFPALIAFVAGYAALGIGRGLELVKERIAGLSDRGVDHLAEHRIPRKANDAIHTGTTDNTAASAPPSE